MNESKVSSSKMQSIDSTTSCGLESQSDDKYAFDDTVQNESLFCINGRDADQSKQFLNQ